MTHLDTAKSKKIGVVVIGRNEGDRLGQCLKSVISTTNQVVYVDSGSTDGSRDLAKKLGVEVVELDLSTPFTAARARNVGFAHLLSLYPQLEFVQFVDGDCEVVNGWLETAQQKLESSPNIAVVCGRRRERSPETSIYNRLCDLEWDTPVGETEACGGDAMMRVSAFSEVEGYNPTLIAGEEPELCVRLRQKGWKIWRLNEEMTLHDAQMLKFSQWWKRTLRSGHAYAEGSWLHGKLPERHWVKESRSIWLWGFLAPLLAVSLAWWTFGLSLLLLGVYPLQLYRIYRSQRKEKARSSRDAALYALSCVLGKFPQWQGQVQFYLSRLSQRPSELIEYKSV